MSFLNVNQESHQKVAHNLLQQYKTRQAVTGWIIFHYSEHLITTKVFLILFCFVF